MSDVIDYSADLFLNPCCLAQIQIQTRVALRAGSSHASNAGPCADAQTKRLQDRFIFSRAETNFDKAAAFKIEKKKWAASVKRPR
jgi:hypothetical protein